MLGLTLHVTYAQTRKANGDELQQKVNNIIGKHYKIQLDLSNDEFQEYESVKSSSSKPAQSVRKKT